MPQAEPASHGGSPAASASSRSRSHPDRTEVISHDPRDYRPYPTAPNRTRRSPASSAGPSSAGPRRSPTPVTIWFTPDPAPVPAGPASPDGTRGTLWPPAVLTAIVTSFSRPGERVLLASWPGSSDAKSHTLPRSPMNDSACSPNPGLDEAAAVVARLGRLVAQPPDTPGGTVSPPNPAGSYAPRLDLVITVMPAQPEVDQAVDGVADVLARLAARTLRLGGILAVLTQCHWDGGVLTDPTGPMVTAAQNADLLYLQHIVAVHLAPTDPRLHETAPTGIAPAPFASVASAAPAHRCAHSDVLVFAQPHDHATGDRARPRATAEPQP